MLFLRDLDAANKTQEPVSYLMRKPLWLCGGVSESFEDATATVVGVTMSEV